jgi:hypothetical protein
MLLAVVLRMQQIKMATIQFQSKVILPSSVYEECQVRCLEI